MKKIKLSKEKYTLVDKSDYEYLSQFSWYLSSVGYAVRDKSRAGGSKRKAILMHREITEAKGKCIVDHINGNKLDNRKSNLRIVTPQINQINRHKLNKNNKSGFRGVSWMKQKNKWRVRIMTNYIEKHIGVFDDIEKAIVARKQAEKLYFGEYTNIGGNF